MRVAPNSPMARAKDSTAPAMMPRLASGSVTLQAVQSSEWPSVEEASSRVRSMDSMAARVVLIMSGRATTNEASTAACQVNRIVHPVHAYRAFPMTPFLPKSTMR